MKIKKLIQIINYILKKYDYSLNYTKLLKLLYLADRQSFDDIGTSITGDVYAALPYGPILSYTYDLICNNIKNKDQQLWNSVFYMEKWNLISKDKNTSLGELSDYEIEVLDNIDKQFHKYTFGQMIDYVHENCPEWQNPQGSSYPITNESILSTLGKSQEEIDFIMEEEKLYAKEDLELAKLSYHNA